MTGSSQRTNHDLLSHTQAELEMDVQSFSIWTSDAIVDDALVTAATLHTDVESCAFPQRGLYVHLLNVEEHELCPHSDEETVAHYSDDSDSMITEGHLSVAIRGVRDANGLQLSDVTLDGVTRQVIKNKVVLLAGSLIKQVRLSKKGNCKRYLCPCVVYDERR